MQASTTALPFTPWSRNGRAVAGAFRMGLRPIPEAQWLPPVGDPGPRLAARRRILACRPEQAHACPEAARMPARELLARIADRPGAETDPVPVRDAPLLAAAERVPDDLCLLDTGDPPRLRAGVLTAPSGWRLDRRLGMDLRALHAPVQGLEEAIGERMRAFTRRLPPGRIFERGNWSLYDDDRDWRPEGDPLAAVPAGLCTDPAVADHLFLRCERQTLRRLPESGWLVFTIRIHCCPVPALTTHPEAAAHLRTAMASLTPVEYRARRLDRVGTGLDRWLAAVETADRGERG